MSSSRPMKGLTYFAPAFAARIAWFAEKMRVVLIFTPSDERALIAFSPSVVIWIFTTTFLCSFASCRPCLIISSAAVVVTSNEIGPSTRARMSWITSDHLRPVFATNVGFVVTPSRTPQEAASRISSMFAVSRKILTMDAAIGRRPRPDMSISACRETSTPPRRGKIDNAVARAEASRGVVDPLASSGLPPTLGRTIGLPDRRPVHGPRRPLHRRVRPRGARGRDGVPRGGGDGSLPVVRPPGWRLGRSKGEEVRPHLRVPHRNPHGFLRCRLPGLPSCHRGPWTTRRCEQQARDLEHVREHLRTGYRGARDRPLRGAVRDALRCGLVRGFGGIPRRDSTPGDDCGDAPWRIDPLPDPRGPPRRPPGTPAAPHRGLHGLVELLLECGILRPVPPVPEGSRVHRDDAGPPVRPLVRRRDPRSDLLRTDREANRRRPGHHPRRRHLRPPAAPLAVRDLLDCLACDRHLARHQFLRESPVQHQPGELPPSDRPRRPARPAQRDDADHSVGHVAPRGPLRRLPRKPHRVAPGDPGLVAGRRDLLPVRAFLARPPNRRNA